MTVGTQAGKVLDGIDEKLPFKCRNGFVVMYFDESFAGISVAFFEVEAAYHTAATVSPDGVFTISGIAFITC